MDKAITKRVTVRASVEEVWRMWSSSEGLQRFFAPHCSIELWPGSPLDIWFFPDNPPGSRGAEGLMLLSFLPQRMLSFQWDAPPHLPAVRSHRNWVVVLFEALDDGQTAVELHHQGWLEGEQWDQAYAYFQDAWDIVLGRFERAVAEGPVDWTAVPG
jgi:uncharacterized protein YndB with AHSA1/START domain